MASGAMVRPVDNIRKELDGLGKATAELAEEFRHGYDAYLNSLGQAVRRQVIMATYHLCTQVYPEEFLALSVGDRGRLQQDIQELGRQGQVWLQQLLTPGRSQAQAGLEAVNLDQMEVALEKFEENLPLSAPAAESHRSEDGDGGSGEKAAAGAEELPAAAEEALALASQGFDGGEAGTSGATLDPRQMLRSVILAAMAQEEEQLEGPPFVGNPLTPTILAQHHRILERQIAEVLHRVSRYANRRLRRAGVLPDLPEALLEMASEADMGMPKGRSVPNVLNAMVAMAEESADLGDRSADEAGEEEESGDDEALQASMTHLAAVHLRLADLEFGDVQSALGRGKLRTSLGRLRKLGKQYQRTQRELAIAQAEQAWRSVWYTDSDGSPR